MGGFFRRGLPVAAAASLVAVLAGCAGDAGASLADAARDPIAETSGGTGLPAGVVPPSGDPQPGDARLGDDGYYDYAADDFVLQNPCDGLPFELAQEQGFDYSDNASPRDDGPDGTVCRLMNGADYVVFASHPFNQRDFQELGYEVTVHSIEDRTWYTVVLPNMLSEMCFAGVDTPNGAWGTSMPIRGFSSHQTAEPACDDASNSFNNFFGGHDDFSGASF